MVIAPDAERVLELARQFRKAPDEIGTQVPAHALVCAGSDALLSETVPVAEIRNLQAPALGGGTIR
jgi:hypothetical protein